MEWSVVLRSLLEGVLQMPKFDMIQKENELFFCPLRVYVVV